MLKFGKSAVTGATAAGKSAVCTLLAEMGATVVSADQIAHQLLNPTTEIGKRVIALLGPEVLEDKKINRDAVAAKVFHDQNLLNELEKILHPHILEEIDKAYQQSKSTFFVAEVPLLFECGWEKYFDTTILVIADQEERQKRFMKKAFLEREARLLPEQVKKEKADYVIENRGSLEELKKQVQNLITN
ncbi:MAG: dephospho-CoA kinase [Chlamydiales bacterium]|nr:dephospho-CoA kinase [Chlamydiales bacterium]